MYSSINERFLVTLLCGIIYIWLQINNIAIRILSLFLFFFYIIYGTELYKKTIVNYAKFNNKAPL